MPDILSTVVSGVYARFYRRGAAATDSHDQYVIPVKDRITSFAGRSTTFATQGLATAATQNLITLHNAAGSTVIVSVNRVTIDLLSIAAAGKAPTVQVPIVRIRRITNLPTAGTVLAKTTFDSTLSSNTAVVATGSTASDGGALTSVASAANLGVITQAWPSRMLVVGTSASSFFEPNDTLTFLEDEPDIILRAGEGIIVTLEGAVVTTGNPATDRWLCTVDFEEFTRP